jgi:rare lipoprotein A (peptidoglycan hydrolase)
MNDPTPRRQAGFNSRSFRETDRIGSRPDRIAFWAVVLAVVVLVAAAASAHASGGIGGSRCSDTDFGARKLSRGDCGADVQTLNWILRSRDLSVRNGLGDEFNRGTEGAVSSLQENAGLRRTGVVDASTGEAVVGTMRKDGASWYGPGFWGTDTACGQTLKRRTVGVAHKSLPCGAKVTIEYRGRFLRTRVIDRGPYVKGRKWDLTAAAAQQLHFTGSGDVRTAIVR